MNNINVQMYERQMELLRTLLLTYKQIEGIIIHKQSEGVESYTLACLPQNQIDCPRILPNTGQW